MGGVILLIKLSNGKKERIAVRAVEEVADKPESYLVANIPQGDKEPSFDGKITVYNDDSERAESYVNEIPTQVKGTEVEHFSKESCSYQLDMVHYKNFYKRGGCLLLVVEISKNEETKIFFKPLLPVELKKLINAKGTQKSYNMMLKALNEDDFYNICRRMVGQMKKQPPTLIENARIDVGDYKKFIFQSITYEYNNDNTKNIFEHDFFQYGIKDNVSYPIGMGRIDSIMTEDQKVIHVNNREYNVDTKIEIRSHQTNLFIENCLQINLIKNNSSIAFKVFDFHSVYSQLKALPLLIDLLKSRELTIDNNFHYKLSSKESFSELIDQLESQFELVQKLDKVFMELDINNQVLIQNKSETYNQICLLINFILDEDYNHLKAKYPDNPGFIKFELGGIFIILYYSPDDLKQVRNPFTEDWLNTPLIVTTHDLSEEEIVSPYLVFEIDTLVKAQNLNFDCIVDSFSLIEKPENDIVLTIVNEFILRCLDAYDITSNTEYLRIVYALIDLYNIQKLSPYEQNILVVNQLQAKYRDKGLDFEDYKMLSNIKKCMDKNNIELEFCINVLLESKREARLNFEQMERKNYYKTLPIFYIYKNL